MLLRLPYRVQIPLGLSLAVVLAALLVTAVSAQIAARAARQEILATVDRTVTLLSAQARPLLAADDTWRAYVLLRNAAALLPGASAEAARAALLDAGGRVIAGSVPTVLDTGRALLGGCLAGGCLPTPKEVIKQWRRDDASVGLRLVQPVSSEDGQVLGFVYIEVDATVFAPDWAASSKPALIGALLAILLLAPAGWWLGQRMTRPVARVAQVIERIGQGGVTPSLDELPRSTDPEIDRISDAVAQWIAALNSRQQAEMRALSAERMATVGRMTAAVAHEINNPLGGLLNAAQNLRLHGGSEVARLRALDLLQRGLHQIRATVAALLPQARVEDRYLELRDLDDVIALAQPMATRFSAQLCASLAVEAAMRVPSSVMRQAMLNMLLNAIKATGEGGTVSACLGANKERVWAEVSNGGEHLTSMALEQSIAAAKGNDPHGFGLWVCRELATQHAGGFDVDASYAPGTRLTFWMPNRASSETSDENRFAD